MDLVDDLWPRVGTSDGRPVRLVPTRDLLARRDLGSLRSGAAGLPVSRQVTHAPVAERYVLGLAGAHSVTFHDELARQTPRGSAWHSEGFLERCMHAARTGKTWPPGPLMGWFLRDAVEAGEGGHRAAAALAAGIREVRVRELDLDPTARPGLDLAPVREEMAAFRAAKKLGPRVSYNPLPGCAPVRAGLDRLRSAYQEVISSRGRSLLDAGCADGYFGVALGEHHLDAEFVDLDPLHLAVVRAKLRVLGRRAPVRRADAVEVLEGGSWSVVLLLSVFHNVLRDAGKRRATRLLRAAMRAATEHLVFSLGPRALREKNGMGDLWLLALARQEGRRLRYAGRCAPGPRGKYGREVYVASP